MASPPEINTVGILTSGGDCPGLNAVIRGVVRKAERHYGWRSRGIHEGFKGLIDDSHEELTVEGCRGILPRGGTIIGTSRYTPYMYEDGLDRVREASRLSAPPTPITTHTVGPPQSGSRQSSAYRRAS